MAKQSFSVGQVLTAAQMQSLQDTALGGGAASSKTADYVLVAADAGTTISMTSTSATTITVNTGLFSAGDTVFIQNLGSATCTITAGTATVNTAGSLILPQYDAGILYFVSASSAIFYDYIQVGAASPLTTKGDLYTFSTSDTRLGVGANGTTLVADSAEATGLKWAAPASGSTFVGAGLYSDAATSLSNSTLTAITWDSEEFDTNGFHSTSTNTSRITIPAGKAGKYLITASWLQNSSNTDGSQRLIRIRKNGDDIRNADWFPKAIGIYPISSVVSAAEGDYFEIFALQNTGTTINTGGDVKQTNFFISYLGA